MKNWGCHATVIIILVFLSIVTGCIDSVEYQNTPSEAQNVFNQTEVSYFEETALGYEYGDSPQVVFRWEKKTVIIHTMGNPDSASLSCLNQAIADFNGISSHIKLIPDAQQDPDIIMYFIPEQSFPQYEPNYKPINMGWFYTYSRQDCSLVNATILISTTGLSPYERCHLIREELTQSMGIARDSDRYPDSIFYQNWTSTITYSEMDSRIISMLYNSGIPRCSDKEAVENFFLNSSFKRSAVSSSG